MSRDPVPRYQDYPDKGCEYGKNCLNECPFEFCIQQIGLKIYHKQRRDRLIKELFYKGESYLSLSLIFSLSVWQIKRIVKKEVAFCQKSTHESGIRN